MNPSPMLKVQGPRLLAIAAAVAAFGSYQAGAAYPDLILSDHPVAYYRLEETSGSTASDSSVSHLDGAYTFNGAATSPSLGQPGINTNSISFVGGADSGYVSIPWDPVFAPAA